MEEDTSWVDQFFVEAGQTFRKARPVRPLELKAPAPDGYIRVSFTHKGIRRAVSLHRLKFLLHHGWLPDCVDHRNNNRADNSLTNLRPATHQDNNRNKVKTDGSSPRGVWKSRNKVKPYRASVKLNRTSKHLGYFETEEEASHVVEEYLRKHHGEFYRDQGI